MRFNDDIVQITINQVGLAVVGLIGWTGVHLPERTPAKWKLRKAGTRLKILEILVRRLITLMALKLDVKPKILHLNAPYLDDVSTDAGPETAVESGGDNVGNAPNGIEEITFSKPRQRSFTLLPALIDFSERPDLSNFPGNSISVDVAAKRFSRRIVALQRVLEAPEAHAKRLARALHKIRQSKELKPVVAPTPVPSGLPPEIGILHGGIAFELRNFLKLWDSS